MNEPKPPTRPAPESREARLARALRDNLRRRKAAAHPAPSSAKPKPPAADEP
jgi:hypothetical protein